MPYVYVVREPFMGFEKGQVISHAQAEAYRAQGGHLDHHAVRVWSDDPVPVPAPSAGIVTGNAAEHAAGIVTTTDAPASPPEAE